MVYSSGIVFDLISLNAFKFNKKQIKNNHNKTSKSFLKQSLTFANSRRSEKERVEKKHRA